MELRWVVAIAVEIAAVSLGAVRDTVVNLY